jgi:hypothetical protein
VLIPPAPGLAQAFIDTFALHQISRIVARRTGAVAAESEFGIEGKSSLHLSPRFIEPTEMRQSSGEMEMCERKISMFSMDRRHQATALSSAPRSS